MIAVRPQQVKPTPKIGVAFAAVPLDVLKNRDLSPSARLAFAALANQARMKRGEVSTYTNRKLGEAAGLSVGTARRALDELEEAGLIRRLFGPTKRIRLAVAITYQAAGEVAQPGASPPLEVAQNEQQGCAMGDPEVAQPRAADLLRAGEKDSESPSLAHQGAEDHAPDGKAGAAYLRACVAAARRGEPMPEPPPSSGLTATRSTTNHGTPLEGTVLNSDRGLSAPQTPQDATQGFLGRMVADLAAGLSRGVLDVRRPAKARPRPKR